MSTFTIHAVCLEPKTAQQCDAAAKSDAMEKLQENFLGRSFAKQYFTLCENAAQQLGVTVDKVADVMVAISEMQLKNYDARVVKAAFSKVVNAQMSRPDCSLQDWVVAFKKIIRTHNKHFHPLDTSFKYHVLPGFECIVEAAKQNKDCSVLEIVNSYTAILDTEFAAGSVDALPDSQESFKTVWGI